MVQSNVTGPAYHLSKCLWKSVQIRTMLIGRARRTSLTIVMVDHRKLVSWLGEAKLQPKVPQTVLHTFQLVMLVLVRNMRLCFSRFRFKWESEICRRGWTLTTPTSAVIPKVMSLKYWLSLAPTTSNSSTKKLAKPSHSSEFLGSELTRKRKYSRLILWGRRG